MPPSIEFRDISLSLPSGRLLLDQISLTIEQGSTTALLGRSGSGKTTLLRTVNRMIHPTSGQVFVEGKDVQAQNLIQLRRSIGYVIQETGLFPHFTVERNAGLVPELEGLPNPDRLRRSHDLLTQVGLDPATFATRYPHRLSGGQRQRVGLARALAANPKILLMDEPFGALDPLTRAEMQDLLKSLLARIQKTVLLVTHDLDEALYLADRIVLLQEGKIIANLTPERFVKSQQPEVQAYLHAFHRPSAPSPAPNSPSQISQPQASPSQASPVPAGGEQ